jgi:RNA polymerase sigma factor (sigma-70 family)
MASSQTGDFLQHLRRALLERDGAGRTDGQLLDDYLSRGDQAALAALVYRHAPMVWGVCRRVLRDDHAAEDAFQATFLVLVRKAASIASPELLANWLYGVAHQTALKARATTAKRWARERQVSQMPEPAVTEQNLGNDWQPLLDQELSRLPGMYRVAIVLCDLEGKTRAEAAQQLGVPHGTLAARLARGREMLGKRLRRRGVAISATTLALVLSRQTVAAAATLPAPLVSATIRSLVSVGTSLAGGIPAHVVALAEQTARGMSRAVLKPIAALVLGLGLLATAGLATHQLGGTTPQVEPVRHSAPPAPPLVVAPQQRLQGVWLVVAAELDGVKNFDQGKGHDRIVFAGDQATYFAPRKKFVGRFRLDTSKTPSAIDIEFDSGGVLKGIYQFDGTRLRLCWTKGGVRPASFDTSIGEILTFLYTYEKQP